MSYSKKNKINDKSTKIKEDINRNDIPGKNKKKDPSCVSTTENNIDGNVAQPAISNEELIRQLGVLNLSIDSLYIILLAITLNISFVKGERAKLLDAINKTNFSKGAPDLSDIPRVTNLMFIYTTGTFLEINYNEYKMVSSVKGKNRSLKAIRMAWRRVLSSILNFLAAIISRNNLEG